jgi:hypothetical protein
MVVATDEEEEIVDEFGEFHDLDEALLQTTVTAQWRKEDQSPGQPRR